MLKPELRQNFTIDATVLEDVANSLNLEQNDKIIEIGAGKGVLSRKILRRIHESKFQSKLLSYEIDKDLLEDLESIKNQYKDSFDFRMQSFLDANPKTGYNKCTGNIPYHISEPLFFKFIEWKFDYIAMITGIKFARKVNGEFPGKLATLSKYLFDIEIVKEYDKTIFYPRSKVDSALIIMKRKQVFETEIDKTISKIFQNVEKKHLWLNKLLGFDQSQLGQIYHMDLDKLVSEIKNK